MKHAQPEPMSRRVAPDQGVTDDRKLFHMLVPVHMFR